MFMVVDENIRLRQKLRVDHLQYGRVVFLPEDIPAEVVDELKKSGLVKSVVRVPAGAREGETAEEAAAAREAAAQEIVSYPAPPSIQLLCQSYSAAVDQNAVSPGRNGPTRISHVQAFTYTDAGAANAPQRWALHISRSEDVGNFAGDLVVFEYADPKVLFGVGSGVGNIFYKQRVDTAVGSRVYPLADFFPRMIIPFSPFYVNLTVSRLNHPATVFVTVDFEPLEMPRGRVSPLSSIETRPVSAEPVAAAAAVVPHLETREFFGFAEIKKYEALGNRIVWSTIRAIPGRPGWSSVTVVTKS